MGIEQSVAIAKARSGLLGVQPLEVGELSLSGVAVTAAAAADTSSPV